MISYDELNSVWKKIVEDYKDRPRLHNCLESAGLLIKENGIVCFSVPNQNQKKWVKEHILDDIQTKMEVLLWEPLIKVDVLTDEEMGHSRIVPISRSSWESSDLGRICAYSNTDGGVINYIYLGEKKDSVDTQLKLIRHKIKKIGPSNSNIIIARKDKPSGSLISVTINPSEDICFVSSRNDVKTYYYLSGGKVIKTNKEDIERFRSIRKGRITKNYITKITSMMTIPDVNFIENFKSENGESVPIFEALSVYGFNRLVGYLKYINRTYANVYSRGECRLHSSLIPSLYRNKTDIESEDKKINVIVNRFIKDSKLSDTLSLSNLDSSSKYIVEGVLQHYGATTSFLDVVDNHWVALWMGLNKYTTRGQYDNYASYTERTIPEIEKLSGDPDCLDQDKWKDLIYQYVLLVAVPFVVNRSENGISVSNSIIEVDLRKALPSNFLRPHAQHGLVIKRNISGSSAQSKDYDLSANVVGIIRVRIDRAKQWIGDGQLLTQDNLIPPPGYDPGYDLLLNKSELFKNSSLKIMKYE